MTSEKGNVVVFALAFFLLSAAGIVLVFVSDSGWTTGRLITFGTTSGLSGILLLFEWKSDRYAVMIFGAGMLGMAAVISIITTFSLYSLNDQLSLGWLILSVLFSVLGIAQAAFLHRVKNRPEDPRFPNVLLREFSKDQILERSGIQVAAGVQTGDVPALVLLLQNCWLADRKVQLSFDTGNIHIGKGDPLLSVSKLDLDLKPAEVTRVIIPVYPNGKPFKAFADVSVAGSGGERIRMWEGKPLSSRMSPGLSFMALFGGMLVWGGGIKFELPALPAVENKYGPGTTPVWQPSPEDMPVVPG